MLSVSPERPPIRITIRRVDRSAWDRFKRHHYLSADLSPISARHCYVGLIGSDPVVFTAVLPFPHPTVPGWREHRTVCLPDFQGVGIGTAMSDAIAACYSVLGPYYSTTTHPGWIAHRARSPDWRMTRDPSTRAAPSRAHGSGATRVGDMRASVARASAAFVWAGGAKGDPGPHVNHREVAL